MIPYCIISFFFPLRVCVRSRAIQLSGSSVLLLKISPLSERPPGRDFLTETPKNLKTEWLWCAFGSVLINLGKPRPLQIVCEGSASSQRAHFNPTMSFFNRFVRVYVCTVMRPCRLALLSLRFPSVSIDFKSDPTTFSQVSQVSQ